MFLLGMVLVLQILLDSNNQLGKQFLKHYQFLQDRNSQHHNLSLELINMQLYIFVLVCNLSSLVFLMGNNSQLYSNLLIKNLMVKLELHLQYNTNLHHISLN